MQRLARLLESASLLSSKYRIRYGHCSIKSCSAFPRANLLSCVPSADGCLAPPSDSGTAVVSVVAPHLYFVTTGIHRSPAVYTAIEIH